LMVSTKKTAEHFFVETINVLGSDDTQLRVRPGCAARWELVPNHGFQPTYMKNLILLVSIVCCLLSYC
jgi:hypothetical protein